LFKIIEVANLQINSKKKTVMIRLINLRQIRILISFLVFIYSIQIAITNYIKKSPTIHSKSIKNSTYDSKTISNYETKSSVYSESIKKNYTFDSKTILSMYLPL
jgi:hypothetical protein